MGQARHCQGPHAHLTCMEPFGIHVYVGTMVYPVMPSLWHGPQLWCGPQARLQHGIGTGWGKASTGGNTRLARTAIGPNLWGYGWHHSRWEGEWLAQEGCH